ncbi:MAG: hypothetical protein R6U88_00485 [Candidatus Bipolaricaulota bacterium]
MGRTILVVVLVAGLLGAVGMTGMAQQAQEREPLLYGLASFFVPGLGQALQGELETGLVHFGVGIAIPIAGSYLAMITPMPGLVWSAIGAVQLGWAVYSGFHSYDMAVDYNERHGFSLTVPMSFTSR